MSMLAGWRRSGDQLRRRDPRLRDALALGRAALALRQVERYPLPAENRLVERLDDVHIDEPFLAGRFRLAVVKDAVGEVEQLRRKLITLLMRAHLLLVTDAELISH